MTKLKTGDLLLRNQEDDQSSIYNETLILVLKKCNDHQLFDAMWVAGPIAGQPCVVPVILQNNKICIVMPRNVE